MLIILDDPLHRNHFKYPIPIYQVYIAFLFTIHAFTNIYSVRQTIAYFTDRDDKLLFCITVVLINISPLDTIVNTGKSILGKRLLKWSVWKVESHNAGTHVHIKFHNVKGTIRGKTNKQTSMDTSNVLLKM